MSKLWFKYGSMNSSKSTQLLAVRFNYLESGMSVELWTARLDNRAGEGVIASRLGVQSEARCFDKGTVFDEQVLGKPNCVLIDEAQFLTRAQVKQLHRYAHMNKVPVMCYGLRTDFKGEAFEGAGELLALADVLEEIKTICKCSRKASMVIRIDEDGRAVREGAQIEIGGNSRYRAVCGRCFYTA